MFFLCVLRLRLSRVFWLPLCCILILHIKDAECCTVINDVTQAQRCLNLTNADAAPQPVDLTSHVPVRGKKFICSNDVPYYTFYCNIYGSDLIWYYNNEIINSFQINDPTGRLFQVNYPSVGTPVNVITTVLTQVADNAASQYCSSTMTVQPYNDDNFEAVPFTVSCQSHCNDENLTTVCQTQHYEVAAKPKMPVKLTQNTSRIAGDPKVPSAVATIYWNSLDDNDTTVVSYNLAMSNIKTADTTFISLLNTSFTKVVTDGTYSINVSAVDLCGQQSDPATLEFRVNPRNECNEEQLKNTVDGLATVFASLTAALIIVITVLSVCLACQCQKNSPTNNVVGKNINYGTSQ